MPSLVGLGSGMAALAAWGAGYLRTVTGNYTSAFWTAGIICLVAAAVLLLIGQGRARLVVIASPAA